MTQDRLMVDGRIHSRPRKVTLTVDQAGFLRPHGDAGYRGWFLQTAPLRASYGTTIMDERGGRVADEPVVVLVNKSVPLAGNPETLWGSSLRLIATYTSSPVA